MSRFAAKNCYSRTRSRHGVRLRNILKTINQKWIIDRLIIQIISISHTFISQTFSPISPVTTDLSGIFPMLPVTVVVTVNGSGTNSQPAMYNQEIGFNIYDLIHDKHRTNISNSIIPVRLDSIGWSFFSEPRRRIPMQ